MNSNGKGHMDTTNGHAISKLDKSTAIEAALVEGDLSKLTTEDRITYYTRMCDSVGLNPTTKPFEYLKLNGKLVLYARKDCTDQLRSLRNVSIQIVARENVGDVYVVTARATTPDGRCDEDVGAVVVSNLKGDNLANATMKAHTKAKRRVTLSICGLGILDESEIETVKGARVVTDDEPTPIAAVIVPPARVRALDEDAMLWTARMDVAETIEDLDVVAAEAKAELAPGPVRDAVGRSYVANKKRLGGK